MVANRNVRSKGRQSQPPHSPHNFIARCADRALLRAVHASKNWRRSWTIRALLQPLHALLPRNDRDSSRNKPDRVLPFLRDHAGPILLSDCRMGVWRKKQDLSHIFHMDTRG